MILHRGLHKKWSGMMMPEHVQSLKQWENEQTLQYPKEKTDWELEDLQQTIMTAYKMTQQIELRLWREKWITLQGKITALKLNQRIMIVETDASVKKIAFHEIDQVKVIDE